jgi:ABC-type phosphate transport system auxiliary subunit
MKDADKEVARLTKRRDGIAADLAETAATRGHAELRELGAELTAVQSELDAAEERWLALGEEAEHSGG